MGALHRYDWPENVRYDWSESVHEIESCIERTVVMCDGRTLEAEDLGLSLRPERRRSRPVSPGDFSWPRNLKDAEQDFIVRTLRRLNGDRAHAAKLLDISNYLLQGNHRDHL